MLEQAQELIDVTISDLYRKKVEIPFPYVLPTNFVVAWSSPIGRIYKGHRSVLNKSSMLRIIASVCVEDDSFLWYHVSFSNISNTIPSYEDLEFVKKYWIGEHRWCVQVFPEKDKHVNTANALHLWHCLEHNPLPDFRKFGMI
jgi:hypothetical protein